MHLRALIIVRWIFILYILYHFILIRHKFVNLKSKFRAMNQEEEGKDHKMSAERRIEEACRIIEGVLNPGKTAKESLLK